MNEFLPSCVIVIFEAKSDLNLNQLCRSDEDLIFKYIKSEKLTFFARFCGFFASVYISFLHFSIIRVHKVFNSMSHSVRLVCALLILAFQPVMHITNNGSAMDRCWMCFIVLCHVSPLITHYSLRSPAWFSWSSLFVVSSPRLFFILKLTWSSLTFQWLAPLHSSMVVSTQSQLQFSSLSAVLDSPCSIVLTQTMLQTFRLTKFGRNENKTFD